MICDAPDRPPRHVLEAMLDMQTDPTAVTAQFGCHVVQCEADQMMPIYRSIDPAGEEVAAMKKRILDFFDTPDPVSDPLTCKLTDADLETAAVVAVTLEKYIAEKSLDGLAYYYEGEPGSPGAETGDQLHRRQFAADQRRIPDVR